MQTQENNYEYENKSCNNEKFSSNSIINKSDIENSKINDSNISEEQIEINNELNNNEENIVDEEILAFESQIVNSVFEEEGEAEGDLVETEEVQEGGAEVEDDDSELPAIQLPRQADYPARVEEAKSTSKPSIAVIKASQQHLNRNQNANLNGPVINLNMSNSNHEEVQNPEENEKKIIHYTKFETCPENNHKIFINLQHCRQDIIHKVVENDPFQFKISKIEPQGEQTQTDEYGEKQVTRLENREFLDQDIIWFDSQFLPEKFSKLKPQQKINHFPGMQLLTRKNFLAKSLKKIGGKFPELQNFFPVTQLLPQEMNQLRSQMQDLQKNNKRKYFIVKPEAECQGKGIKLVSHHSEIDFSDDNRWVCQQYISKPQLIDGLKFDIRQQVLVTSVDPFRIFLHHDAFLRLCTHEYEAPTYKNIDNLNMHLTNYAINKTDKNFVKNNNDDIYKGEGSKRHVQWFYDYLTAQGHDVTRIQKDIEKILVKTLLSVQPNLRHQQKSCQPNDFSMNMCFEILGFDIMLDHKLKPQLIEVNHAPSFNTDSKLDSIVKRNMLSDTFSLLQLVGPKAKSLHRRQKAVDMEKKRVVNNFSLLKEDKMRQAQEHIVKKDKQTTRNKGGQQLIQPNECDEAMAQEQALVSEQVNLEWGSQTATRKGAEREGKKVEVPKPRVERVVEPKEDKVASREEIDSIVNRLYQNRLSTKGGKSLQEAFREVEQREEAGPENNPSVVDINFEGAEACTMQPTGLPSQSASTCNLYKSQKSLGTLSAQTDSSFTLPKDLSKHTFTNISNTFGKEEASERINLKSYTDLHVRPPSVHSVTSANQQHHFGGQGLNGTSSLNPRSASHKSTEEFNFARGGANSKKIVPQSLGEDTEVRVNSNLSFQSNSAHGSFVSGSRSVKSSVDNIRKQKVSRLDDMNIEGMLVSNKINSMNLGSHSSNSYSHSSMRSTNANSSLNFNPLTATNNISSYQPKSSTVTRDKSNDNYNLYMQKLLDQNKDYQDPINVIEARNITRTLCKKVSQDKNDRPQSKQSKSELPKDKFMNLCINGRGATIPKDPSKKNHVPKGFSGLFNFNNQ